MQSTIKKLKLGSEITAAAAVAVGVGVWIFFKKSLPPLVPLFYSKPWGEEQLAPNYGIVIPLIIAITVTLVSIFTTKFLKNEPVLTTIILASGIVIGLILIIGMLRSVMIVI